VISPRSARSTVTTSAPNAPASAQQLAEIPKIQCRSLVSRGRTPKRAIVVVLCHSLTPFPAQTAYITTENYHIILDSARETSTMNSRDGAQHISTRADSVTTYRAYRREPEANLLTARVGTGRPRRRHDVRRLRHAADRSIQLRPRTAENRDIVRARISKSIGSEQFSTYRRSSRIASSHDRSDRPETCHSPGRPGLTTSRRVRRTHNSATLTRQWWARTDKRHVALDHIEQLGISSTEKRRSQRPTGVILGSYRI